MRCFLGLHNWNHYSRHESPYRRCIHCSRTEKAVTDHFDGATFWRLTVLEA